MLRTAIRAHIRPVVVQGTHRGLVSSVLLTRPYEDKSLVELRQEAKKRGLTQSGTKATLVARIFAEDKRRTLEELASSNATIPSQIRTLSSSPPAAAEPTATPSAAKEVWDIKLPDLSVEPPEPPVKIPFYPDFWESSKVNAAEAAKEEALPKAPKIIVTAGESTHPDGGPSHNLYQPELHSENHTESSSHVAPPTPPTKGGIWQDMAEDLGIPSSLSLEGARTSLQSALTEREQSTRKEKSSSRPLNEEETRGLWTLLGIVVGTWVVSGVASPSRGKTASAKSKAH